MSEVSFSERLYYTVIIEFRAERKRESCLKAVELFRFRQIFRVGVRLDQYRFIIGIDNETCLGFRRLFYEFPLAIIHGYFTARTSVRIIGADFGGKQ